MSPDIEPVSRNKPLLDDWKKTLDNEVIISPCTPIALPTRTLIERTLEALALHGELHPGKPALIDAFNQDRFLTYRQIRDQALSVAAFLQSIGFSVGDRATAVLRNCIEFPVIHLGVWSAGGAFVGCNTAYAHHELVYQLQDSATSVVFTSEALLDSVLRAVHECPQVKNVICIRSSTSPIPESVIDFRDVLEFEPIQEIVPVAMDAPCMIYYSSGTTGLPKGIIHTHRTYHSNVDTLRSHFLHEVYPVLPVNEVDWYQDCQIVSSACYHMLGFGLLNWCLLTGAPVILMERLDEVLFPKLIAQFKPRYLFVAPPIFAYLAKDSAGRVASLESVQLILCSSAPLSQEISDEFLAHHPTVRFIVQGYGMTETGYSHLPLLLREGADASSGVVASHYEQIILLRYLYKYRKTCHAKCKLQIVVPGSMMPVKRGEWGEICVKGPGVTVGYFNNPEATELLFNEGWLITGDIGYLDELGRIHIVDRVKELIKVYYENGMQSVPPAELEGVLLSASSIRDVAVVGIPHESGSEHVRAFVVKAEEHLTKTDVKQIIADKLAPYKQLTGGVVFVDAIPRSATGKILRRELRGKS